jgi:hypothetical protein
MRNTSQAAHHGKRGVALMEALIVASVTSLFFGATWFFHELNHRKESTLQTARYQAWAATRFSCEGTSVSAQPSHTVGVPGVLQRAGTPESMAVSSRTEMACNVKPRPEDTVLSAFSSFADLIPW